MQASSYLGDLGGLPEHRALVLLDLRATGESAVPADTSTYRCDRQVDDVETMRATLGLDRIDLFGHSAGGTLALLYATRYPEHVERLLLVNPSSRPVGIEITDADRRELAEARRGEPWFPDAFAAFERIWSGRMTEADWVAISPFMYGHWDAGSQAHHTLELTLKNPAAAAVYYSAGAFDPAIVRSGVAKSQMPVLLMTGEHDVGLPPKRAAEYADLFPNAELVVQQGGGHYGWLDDPEWFVATITTFLDS